MKTEKNKDPGYPQTAGSNDFHGEIRLQVQIVARETAKLIGLLAEGSRGPDVDPPEYEMIREFGTAFLHELVRTARGLDIQLQ